MKKKYIKDNLKEFGIQVSQHIDHTAKNRLQYLITYKNIHYILLIYLNKQLFKYCQCGLEGR